jgi:hypothetical protein
MGLVTDVSFRSSRMDALEGDINYTKVQGMESDRRRTVLRRLVCGCVGAAGGYIVEGRMRAYFNRFGFTFRYWRTIAGSAD